MAESLLERVQTQNTPAETLRGQLLRNRAHHAALQADPGLNGRLRAIRQWQCERLCRSHADLLAEPGSARAVRFLIDELYGGQDFRARAAHVEKAFPIMVRFLPKRVLKIAALAMQLYVLTKDLDRRLADTLFLRLDAADLNDNLVAEGYRITADYRRRMQQIDLLRELARLLTKYTNSAVIGPVVRLAKVPARLLGLGELQRFLAHGFAAFQAGANIDFIKRMADREVHILDRIHADDPAPFSLPTPY